MQVILPKTSNLEVNVALSAVEEAFNQLSLNNFRYKLLEATGDGATQVLKTGISDVDPLKIIPIVLSGHGTIKFEADYIGRDSLTVKNTPAGLVYKILLIY